MIVPSLCRIIIVLLAVFVVTNWCSPSCPTEIPTNCPSKADRPLHLPILNKVVVYLQNGHLPLPDLIRSVPLISFNEKFLIEVTFINSGGAFKNQLGYFVLPAGSDTLPDPKLLNTSLIFWDTNPECVGAGDAIKIGPFDANVKIGFYLVSNGWCGGTDKLYSLSAFNNASQIVTAVFFDVASNTLVVGMEDIPNNPADDFQDVVFQIDALPALVSQDLKSYVPLACDLSCESCNFTSGECAPVFRRRPPGRYGVVIGIVVGLVVMLIIAIGVIIYLIRVKSVGKGVLPEQWYPETQALADELQYDDTTYKKVLTNNEEDNL